MAKNAKKTKPKALPVKSKPEPSTKNNAKTMTSRELTATPMVAAEAPHSLPVDITFDFTSGIGQVTATLFRKGVLINMQSISNSGKIRFSEVQSRDAISINGVCTGKAVITVNTPTIPDSPQEFNAELILTGFFIK
jgi:hypothetical protein